MGVVSPERERERAAPPPPAPEPPPSRPRRPFPWVLVLLLALGLAAWAARDWVDGILPSLSNPFAAETVDRSGPAVLQAVRDLHELRAASGHFEVIVDLERDTRLPAAILGERTLFVGVGDVDATVDLSGLGPGAVAVSPDRRSATIRLPRPRLSEVRLDLGRSHVYDRDRGVLNRIGGVFGDDGGAARDVYLLAQRRIAAAARNGSGLVLRAEANTRAVLERLLRSLGFRTVDVRFASRAA